MTLPQSQASVRHRELAHLSVPHAVHAAKHQVHADENRMSADESQ